MKLVVGLGNPGRKYEGTRHNVGWEALAELSRRFAGPAPRLKFEAELVEIPIGDERVLLAAPQTFMNLSGRSVRQIVDFWCSGSPAANGTRSTKRLQARPAAWSGGCGWASTPR
jgi:PTH1 family peptidyl-tRNA hydrolase